MSSDAINFGRGLPALVAMALWATVAALVPKVAHADPFDCRDVAPDAPRNQRVFLSLTDQLGIEPVEFGYCDHDRSPRWVARWVPFESAEVDGQLWRRYATARCWDHDGEHTCQITNHVVAGASHVVVDFDGGCDISIAAIAAIHRAAARIYPGYEMKEIEFAIVRDGGAWTASDYGYHVKLSEPRDFDQGPIRRFVLRCTDGACRWHDSGSEGTWLGGSTHLPSLRRAQGDPLIELIEP